MKRKFDFEFEDQAFENSISFEYDDAVEEEMTVIVENGVPVMYANRQAFLSLAKTFIKIALCDYSDGFHIHLGKDFDTDQPEILRVVLNN
jgi:hypothetical protein